MYVPGGVFLFLAGNSGIRKGSPSRRSYRVIRTFDACRRAREECVHCTAVYTRVLELDYSPILVRKGGGIRIINFRITAILQSKSNRCIWHTTFIILKEFLLLTRPGLSYKSKFPFWSVLNIFTSQNWDNYQYLLLTIGVIIQNLFI
jgi:hypothetical protein